jgi:hypothetical protein
MTLLTSALHLFHIQHHADGDFFTPIFPKSLAMTSQFDFVFFQSIRVIFSCQLSFYLSKPGAARTLRSTCREEPPSILQDIYSGWTN